MSKMLKINNLGLKGVGSGSEKFTYTIPLMCFMSHN